jgi:hypothetical protein
MATSLVYSSAETKLANAFISSARCNTPGRTPVDMSLVEDDSISFILSLFPFLNFDP